LICERQKKEEEKGGNKNNYRAREGKGKRKQYPKGNISTRESSQRHTNVWKEGEKSAGIAGAGGLGRCEAKSQVSTERNIRRSSESKGGTGNSISVRIVHKKKGPSLRSIQVKNREKWREKNRGLRS